MKSVLVGGVCVKSSYVAADSPIKKEFAATDGQPQTKRQLGVDIGIDSYDAAWLLDLCHDSPRSNTFGTYDMGIFDLADFEAKPSCMHNFG